LQLSAQGIGTARDTVPQATAASAAEERASAYAIALRPLLDRALLTNDTTAFERLINYLDASLARYPNDPVLLHYRGFAQFREASTLLAAHGAKGSVGGRAKRLFEAADRSLERAATGVPWPETMALRASITGQLIAFGNPFTAMRLGSRASRQMEEALAAGPDNPRVWMLRGVGDFYRPRLFGGGLEKSEAHLRRAIELFASDDPIPPAPSWGRAEVYGWLGQVLGKQGKRAEARAAYEKGLTIEPGNKWIADALLPALERDAR
jgi:tetratricopeptide (TPR) repeat protein